MATSQDMIKWFDPIITVTGTYQLYSLADFLGIGYTTEEWDEDDDFVEIQLDDPADFGKLWKKAYDAGISINVDQASEIITDGAIGAATVFGQGEWHANVRINAGDISDPDEIDWLEHLFTFYIGESPVNTYDNRFKFDCAFSPDVNGYVNTDVYSPEEQTCYVAEYAWFNWDEEKGDYVEGDGSEGEGDDLEMAWTIIDWDTLHVWICNTFIQNK